MLNTFYTHNPDGQATLNEILTHFDGHSVYQLDADTTTELVAVVAPNGNVLVTFEPLEDDDNDGTPKVYQVYDTNYDNVLFSEVAYLWADTVVKL